MEPQDWVRQLKANFDEELNQLPGDERKDPEAIAAHFAHIIEWHAEATAEALDDLKEDGKMAVTVGKYAQTFNTMVCLCDDYFAR